MRGALSPPTTPQDNMDSYLDQSDSYHMELQNSPAEDTHRKDQREAMMFTHVQVYGYKSDNLGTGFYYFM